MFEVMLISHTLLIFLRDRNVFNEKNDTFIFVQLVKSCGKLNLDAIANVYIKVLSLYLLII